MFQAGVKGMSERSELIPCIILYNFIYKEEPHNNNKRFTESAELTFAWTVASLYVYAQLAVHVHKASGKFLA